MDEWVPRQQRRPLVSAERALLHRVIGLVDGSASYAYTMRPAMRDVLGDGSVAQTRELSLSEREGLDDMIRLVLIQAGRLEPVRDLTAADAALLHVVQKGISARYEPGDERILVNIEDWMPPAAFPVDWKVANSAERVDGYVAWQEQGLYGQFYAAAPEWIWDKPGDYYGGPMPRVRPVVPMADSYIAARVGSFLASYGLSSPDDVGLTTAEASLALGLPWKGVTGRDNREPYLAGLLRPERVSFPRPLKAPRARRSPSPGRRGGRAGQSRPPRP